MRVSFARMVVAAPLWIAASLVLGIDRHGLTPRALTILGLSTLCSYAFADSVFFAAASSIGVSSAMAIASTYPLWAALEGTLVEGEAFGPARAAGTLLCVLGVATIIKLGGGRDSGTPRARGIVLAFAASLMWAANTVAIKIGATGLDLTFVAAYRYTFALCVLGVLVLLGRAPGPSRPARGWLPMLPAILTDCVLGTLCFLYALTHTDLAVGATLTSLAPLVSLPIAVWLGAEKITPAKLVAVITTVAGAVLVSR